MSRSLLCHAGEIWPGELTAEESVFPVLKRDGLSFVLIMDDPVEVEISGVCHGLVRYGVTEKQNIPFVFISFAGALLDVDCYINLLREPADVQDAFTEGMPDNSIVLYIVDLKSGKTVDTRQFTADPSFVRQIQDIAAAQHTAYDSADAVEAAATGILADQTSIWLLMGKKNTSRCLRIRHRLPAKPNLSQKAVQRTPPLIPRLWMGPELSNTGRTLTEGSKRAYGVPPISPCRIRQRRIRKFHGIRSQKARPASALP